MPRRGGAWFVVQLLLFIAVLGAPMVRRKRPTLAVRLLGLGLLDSGATVAVAGYRELGESHSPWTTPTAEHGALVTTGMYARLRHPIYAGWCLGSLGFEVATGSRLGISAASALIVFYDLKSREEDRHLADRYPGAGRYGSDVKRFVPGVY
jgi:protein-S-isoprenylcysteine O-methyltransferase Ste14